jgi:hypothetical protein
MELPRAELVRTLRSELLAELDLSAGQAQQLLDAIGLDDCASLSVEQIRHALHKMMASCYSQDREFDQECEYPALDARLSRGGEDPQRGRDERQAGVAAGAGGAAERQRPLSGHSVQSHGERATPPYPPARPRFPRLPDMPCPPRPQSAACCAGQRADAAEGDSHWCRTPARRQGEPASRAPRLAWPASTAGSPHPPPCPCPPADVPISMSASDIPLSDWGEDEGRERSIINSPRQPSPPRSLAASSPSTASRARAAAQGHSPLTATYMQQHYHRQQQGASPQRPGREAAAAYPAHDPPEAAGLELHYSPADQRRLQQQGSGRDRPAAPLTGGVQYSPVPASPAAQGTVQNYLTCDSPPSQSPREEGEGAAAQAPAGARRCAAAARHCCCPPPRSRPAAPAPWPPCPAPPAGGDAPAHRA